MEGNILSAQLIEDTKKIILSDFFHLIERDKLYRSHICLTHLVSLLNEHFYRIQCFMNPHGLLFLGRQFFR